MKKSRKSKIVLLSVLGLATVSLATVGFASWVINEVTPATSNNITAEVGSIVDNTLKATIDTVNSDLKVRFDNLSTGTTMGNGDGKTQDLDFRINTTITTTGTTLKGLLTSVKYEFTLETFLTSAIDNEYITFDKTSKVATITVSDSGASTTTSGFEVVFNDVQSVTVKGTFSFGWGAAFNGDNPGKLNPSETNSKKSTKTNLEVLKDFVNSFNSASQNLLTVKVTPNGTI